MTNTAAVYKFIHDQTLFYINHGYTETEIDDMIQLPAELKQVWYTRQYYGTLKHNVKAVYQKYMGWYDANPIHLDELTPTEYAQKLVEYLGDTDQVLEMAKADFEKGEYQRVAEITNALVYADPDNLEARYLCADATWSTPKAALFALLQGNADGVQQVAQLQGGEELLDTICAHILIFTPDFTIIEP